jgi:hypothetical protein
VPVLLLAAPPEQPAVIAEPPTAVEKPAKRFTRAGAIITTTRPITPPITIAEDQPCRLFLKSTLVGMK